MSPAWHIRRTCTFYSYGMTVSLYDYDTGLYFESHHIHEFSMTYLQVFILTPHDPVTILLWCWSISTDSPHTWVQQKWHTCKFLSLHHDRVTIWLWYWSISRESLHTWVHQHDLSAGFYPYAMTMSLYDCDVGLSPQTWVQQKWHTCKFLSLRQDPVTIWLWCWSISRESPHTWGPNSFL